MKRLNLLIAFALASAISTTALAFNFDSNNPVIGVEVLQEKVEIPLSDLPAGVTNFLSSDFSGYTVEKAYKSERDGSMVYYVDLSKDGEVVTLLFDADGNVIAE